MTISVRNEPTVLILKDMTTTNCRPNIKTSLLPNVFTLYPA